jgi:hypothetical protein
MEEDKDFEVHVDGAPKFFKYNHAYIVTVVFDKVEEYSAFTKQELYPDLYITVNGMESSEVLASPSGSIVYFSSPIEGKLEAGISYTCICSPFSTEAWMMMVDRLNKFPPITIEELRNKL